MKIMNLKKLREGMLQKVLPFALTAVVIGGVQGKSEAANLDLTTTIDDSIESVKEINTSKEISEAEDLIHELEIKKDEIYNIIANFGFDVKESMSKEQSLALLGFYLELYEETFDKLAKTASKYPEEALEKYYEETEEEIKIVYEQVTGIEIPKNFNKYVKYTINNNDIIAYDSKEEEIVVVSIPMIGNDGYDSIVYGEDDDRKLLRVSEVEKFEIQNNILKQELLKIESNIEAGYYKYNTEDVFAKAILAALTKAELVGVEAPTKYVIDYYVNLLVEKVAKEENERESSLWAAINELNIGEQSTSDTNTTDVNTTRYEKLNIYTDLYGYYYKDTVTNKVGYFKDGIFVESNMILGEEKPSIPYYKSSSFEYYPEENVLVKRF